MKEAFSIDTEWLSSPNTVKDEDKIANITINLLGKNLTENYDIYERQKQSSVALAPYPMALWFASNWWRLRWEVTPSNPTTDWRMSHMLSAAGYGYSWPTIGFQTDGEIIRITSLPTSGMNGASVIYNTSCSEIITANKFESTVTSFIKDCNTKFGDSDISSLWEIIQEEKDDKELATYRQLEARLGFDAGEGPESEILAIMEHAKNFGHDSTQEISNYLYKEQETIDKIQSLEKGSSGLAITICDLSSLRTYAKQKNKDTLPWDLGYELAQEARRIWGINSIFSTEELCNILNISQDNLFSDQNSDLGLGVKHSKDAFQILLKKKHIVSQRFMLARMICDAIIAPDEDKILSATTNKTARQKTQRAFAAELLCPIELIKESLGNDYNNRDNWADVADDFKVSMLVVQSQLANHNIIDSFENQNLWLPLLRKNIYADEF